MSFISMAEFGLLGSFKGYASHLDQLSHLKYLIHASKGTNP
jgi:hypothetical protein